jgi:hypothetical protein
MIQEQQPDDETRTTTMEDDNYFDSYEDIEVRSTSSDIFFFNISTSCCVFNQCEILVLVASMDKPQKLYHCQMCCIVHRTAHSMYIIDTV